MKSVILLNVYVFELFVFPPHIDYSHWTSSSRPGSFACCTLCDTEVVGLCQRLIRDRRNRIWVHATGEPARWNVCARGTKRTLSPAKELTNPFAACPINKSLVLFLTSTLQSTVTTKWAKCLKITTLRTVATVYTSHFVLQSLHPAVTSPNSIHRLVYVMGKSHIYCEVEIWFAYVCIKSL